MSARGSFKRYGRNALYGHTLPHHLEGYAPGLENYWKVWDRVNGRVTEHLSPFQTKNLDALFSHPVEKAMKRIKSGLPAVPFILASIGTMYYFTAKRDARIISERP